MQNQTTETTETTETLSLARKCEKNLAANLAGAVTLEQAAALFVARRERWLNPSGRFDRGRRWWPANDENQDCCNVRTPSRAHPYSLMLHCRTAEHVAQLCGQQERGITAAAIRKAARSWSL